MSNINPPLDFLKTKSTFIEEKSTDKNKTKHDSVNQSASHRTKRIVDRKQTKPFVPKEENNMLGLHPGVKGKSL
jgi:hypothetical protein